jgi:hypothetical protein
MPGPICTWERNYEVDDGTSCRMPSQPPGPKQQRSPTSWARGAALYEAYERAKVLATAAVYHKTGYALGQVLEGLLPGLLQTLLLLAATTTLGGVAGGVIGFFFGGVGAAPGAVVGADLGLDIGVAALTWLGLGFLATAMIIGAGELWASASSGVRRAWAAPESPEREYPHEIDKAAHDLADAVGIFVLLVLQAIVAWVFKRAAVASTEAALTTGRYIQAAGSEAAAGEAVGVIVQQLRTSRLGTGFADWVEQNWPQLRDDPRLRFRTQPPAGGAEVTAQADVELSPSKDTTGVEAAGGTRRLKYQPSSGAKLEAEPGRTTTILGNYARDMKEVTKELGNQKALDFGPKPGGFNVLNAPDELYQSPEQFWQQYNRPFLDQGIQRGDKFVLATNPDSVILTKPNGELTGFGREYQYLIDKGYHYDPIDKTMVR